MHKEFEVNKVSEEGLEVMNQIAILFDNLLTAIKNLETDDPHMVSIVRYKLQEACFFAKKGMAPKYKI